MVCNFGNIPRSATVLWSVRRLGLFVRGHGYRSQLHTLWVHFSSVKKNKIEHSAQASLSPLPFRLLTFIYCFTIEFPHMGRPAVSTANKRLAVSIALMLTRQTDNPSDTIARCGKCSIFALLKVLSPTIIRENNSGPRDGISEVELNKALQVCKETYFT
jgi:hypothetical protein